MKNGASLPVRALVLWECAALAATAVLLALLTVLLEPWFFLRLWALWLVGLAAIYAVFYYLPMRFLYTEYRLDPDCLLVEKGVFWQSVSCISKDQVSFVQTFQGPLCRLLKLSSLRAAAPGGTVWLMFLPKDEARRILLALSPAYEG